MHFLQKTGKITPEGLKKALETVAAIIYIVWQVLSFISQVTKNSQR